MAKAEWGVKRLCASCGARFYDLNRDPIACPACGAAFEAEAAARVKRLRVSPRVAEDKAVVVDAELIDDDADEDDDVTVLEDEDDDDAVTPAAPTAAVEDDEDEVIDDEDTDVLLEDDDDDDVEAELDDLVEGDEDDLKS